LDALMVTGACFVWHWPLIQLAAVNMNVPAPGVRKMESCVPSKQTHSRMQDKALSRWEPRRGFGRDTK
jgi:hypothetical protein